MNVFTFNGKLFACNFLNFLLLRDIELTHVQGVFLVSRILLQHVNFVYNINLNLQH